MNKQQEIRELKEHLYNIHIGQEKAIDVIRKMEKLEKLEQEKEKPIKPGFGWLKKGVFYWFINDRGEVDKCMWLEYKMDIYRRNHNNVYIAEEEAQRFLDIENKIYEIQNKNPVDWGSDNDTYPIPYMDGHGDIRGCPTPMFDFFTDKHKFRSADSIEEIKQALSSDDIDFYFRRV